MIYRAGQLSFLFCHVLMCVVLCDTVSLVVLVSCVQSALPRCFHGDSTAKLLQSLALAYAAASKAPVLCLTPCLHDLTVTAAYKSRLKPLQPVRCVVSLQQRRQLSDGTGD